MQPVELQGMHHAPKGRTAPVVEAGAFAIAAVGLDHGHIYGMCGGLKEAGARIAWVYDPDPEKGTAFQRMHPEAKAARSLDEVLADPKVHMVAGAAVPAQRCALGLAVMDAGKDYFTDKAPFTTLLQLKAARLKHRETGRKYAVYYSERLHSEAGVYAGILLEQGAIGRVLQVIGFGPHRLSAASRPDWFFQKEHYGGILCDIGSHQVEQFLFYSGAKDAQIQSSAVANYNHKEAPELEDFGEASLLGDNGCSNYFRVDWFTPDGLKAWGDGRTFILGTDGYIELRKYIDIARDSAGDHLYLITGQGEQHFALSGQVGYPFFGRLILDCLNRTEEAMSQAHAFKAAELSLRAQEIALRIE